jgi:hypothetical protein
VHVGELQQYPVFAPAASCAEWHLAPVAVWLNVAQSPEFHLQASPVLQVSSGAVLQSSVVVLQPYEQFVQLVIEQSVF